MMKRFFVLCVCIFLLCGCSSKIESKQINYMEAKEKMINEEAVLVDVRTKEEYDEKHIDGAILFTLDTINEMTVKDMLGDKSKVYIVYCRSGNRSSQALQLLEDLGYENVFDLGAMSNWEEE